MLIRSSSAGVGAVEARREIRYRLARAPQHCYEFCRAVCFCVSDPGSHEYKWDGTYVDDMDMRNKRGGD